LNPIRGKVFIKLDIFLGVRYSKRPKTAGKEFFEMRNIIRLMALVVFVMIFIGPALNALANKSAASILAPKDAAKGTEVTIKINIVHHGNSSKHYTNWVYLKVNGKEVQRWEFSDKNLPEGDNFSREFKVKVEGNLELEAESNCNVHGTAGPAKQKIEVK
jgi:desulfoferrodoxin (superoxide reductase-like protein)